MRWFQRRAEEDSFPPGRPAGGPEWRKAAKEVGLHEPWWRRLAWGRWGAVAGVIAAVGTLLFSGVATYYQAQVAEDQLNQSRKEAESDEQDHARRVAFWESSATTAITKVHIVNRSPDPISFASLTFALSEKWKWWKLWEGDFTSTPVHEYFRLNILGLGPCTELVYSPADLLTVVWDSPNKYEGKRLANYEWTVVQLNFSDRNGVGWKRSGAGLSRAEDRGRPWQGNLRPTVSPQVNKAATCGNDDLETGGQHRGG